MSDKLIIQKNYKRKGEDGYQLISVRIKNDILIRLNDLSAKSNHKRNNLINLLLDYAIKNSKVKNN